MLQLRAALLLLACLGVLAWSVWRGARRVARLGEIGVAADRRRALLRRVLVPNVLVFLGGSIAGLAILGDLGCLFHPPRPFFGLMRGAHALLRVGDIGPMLLGGLVGGACTAVVIAVIAAQRHRGQPARPPRRGVAPLLPRDGPETVIAALIATNAGVSEELFFRLLLPLLFTLTIGSATVGFLAAAVLFGIVHLYQGIAGIAATFVLGLVFTGLYIVTGSLAAPIVLHLAIDLMALVVRPTLARLAARP
jgi:membrane protease YdiL (CAAX protease family)